MKLKIVVVDFEIPMRVKKWAIRAGIPAVILTVAAVAYADALHTWTTGDTLNATDLNGNFANLQSQITTPTLGTRAPSGFHAYLITPVTVTSGPNVTAAAFDHVEFDLAKEYSATTGIFTPQSAGVYVVRCAFEFNANGTSALWGVQLQKNTLEIDATDVQSGTETAANGGIRPELSAILQLAAGDSVTCAPFQFTGSPQALNESNADRNTFSAVRLY